MEPTVKKSGHTVYCHFSFRRPKGVKYGIFAVAIYADFEGKRLLARKTQKFDLWEDHQFITAIQSYEHALSCIYEWQGQMKRGNIRQVMLVTDNSILAGWIVDPYKNKTYTQYMLKAVKLYKVGGAKEIVLGIGLCEPRKAEKAYKYCREELVSNKYIPTNSINPQSTHLIPIETDKSALDIVSEDIAIPTIVGAETLEVKLDTEESED